VPRVARVSFTVPKDSADLRRERETVGGSIAPVFDYDSAAVGRTISALRRWDAAVDSVLRAVPGTDPRPRLAEWLVATGIPPTYPLLDVLADSRRRGVLLALTDSSLRKLATDGVLLATRVPDGMDVLRVRGTPGGDRLVPAHAVLTTAQLRSRAAGQLPDEAGAAAVELQNLLLIRFLRPTLVPNPAETEATRQRARAAVDPVELRVRPGDTLLAAGVRVGDAETRRLEAYQAALVARGLARPPKQQWVLALGSFLYNCLALGLVGLLLWLRGRPEFADLRSLALLSLLIVAVAAGAAAVTRLGLPVETIPVPFAVLVVAVLGGAKLALPLALILALLLVGQPPFVGIAVPFSAAIGGAVAVVGVRTAHQRTQVWRPITAITLGYGAVALTLALVGASDWTGALSGTKWGAINAIVSTFLAIGFLPLFESWVRVTTQQTLLELSDTNRALLRRLQHEANGTFHHTINVANLAEAACQAIGANALLARVGALYHDVGKLAKPQYFIENQPVGRNPHDKLKPTTSAEIVRSHVPEGLRLADRAGLPDAVRRFIPEHHGTQRIGFFFEQVPGANPADFSYIGPKPQTRETGVLMLADSVESAAHVLADPTPVRLRELVERITAGKIAAGQLDECPLTLHDIRVIKDELSRVLAGMYHHRIDYPSAPVDLAARQPAASLPAQRG
jgi:putative nucleotidyltransferase with HDIG domain